jgi:DNA-binding MarR family transcriptional regulator
MVQKYQLLKELLPLLEQYESETTIKEPNLMSFSVWLNRHLSYPAHSVSGSEDMDEIPDESSETILTMLISYLNRYAKHYSKKALEDTPLSTIDEFTFLATLSYQESLTKTELIQTHLLEITSGIEIIKRLTKNELLTSFKDPNDRRSKRVKLTPKGREVFKEVMAKMDEVAHILAGDLSSPEREQLLPLLYKMNDFHSVIHRQDRKSDLDEIREKYLPQILAKG